MKKKNGMVLIILGIVTAFMIFKNRKKIIGGKVLRNDSNFIIYYKPEEDETNNPDGIATPLSPKQIPKERVDGIASPSFRKGMVYKLPDYCSINILIDGSIEMVSCPPESIVRWSRWLGIEFHNFLLSQKDTTWNSLFDKANGK